MLQSFSRAYLDAVDQAHLGMSDTVAGSLRSRRWGDTPSMKRHGHPFPVAGDALKGACFLPILGWCRHDDWWNARTRMPHAIVSTITERRRQGSAMSV
jgi:hypothetical protein